MGGEVCGFCFEGSLDLDQGEESTERGGRSNTRKRVRRSSRDGAPEKGWLGSKTGGGETLTLGRGRDALQFKVCPQGRTRVRSSVS